MKAFNAGFLFMLKQVAAIEGYLKPRINSVRGRFQLDKIRQKGAGCFIYGSGTLIDPDNVVLGDGVQIGGNFYFAATGGIEIGDFCHLSRNVTIYSRNHDYHSGALPYDSSFVCKPVRIGKCVWIGMNVNIVPGVTIGDGAIIGIGTTISRDVPEGAIVVGSAARIVAQRDQDHYRRLISEGRYWGRNNLIVKKESRTSMSETS